MIKYRPVRGSLSASIKEECTFSTMEEMFHFLYDKAVRIAMYTGSALPDMDDIIIGTEASDNNAIGYKSERTIMFKNTYCIGYCGE